jgi:secondary thiamine-phosphate synthase enzyme
MNTFTVSSSQQTELIDITERVAAELKKSGISDGILLVYVPHTTAAVTINEGADPSVKSDLLMALNKIVPWQDAYKHLEGNSPAHIKASLIGPSEMVIIEKGRLVLGTWQAIFLCEFDGPRTRRVYLKWLTR